MGWYTRKNSLLRMPSRSSDSSPTRLAIAACISGWNETKLPWERALASDRAMSASRSSSLAEYASPRGYPDARRHGAELAVPGKVKRLSQRRKQVPRDILGAWLTVRSLDQDHELVPAEPADRIGLAHHRTEAMGNLT